MNISRYLQQKLLGVTVLGTPFTSPATLGIALLTACSSDGQLVTEVGTFDGYVRQPVAWGAIFDEATQSGVKNSAAVNYSVPTTNWGTITHMAIYDSLAAGGGNQLFWGQLDSAKVIDSGNPFQFPINNLVLMMG